MLPLDLYSLLLFLLPFVVILLKKYFNGGVCKFTADLSSKVIIITGSNKGLGKQVAFELTKMNAIIVMACRDLDKAAATKEEILKKYPLAKIDLIKLDLSDFASIREFVKTFTEKYTKLDVLINNAGVITEKRELTKDGHELMISTNYFGPFLLTNLLLDVLKATKFSRIINLTSLAHHWGFLDLDDLNREKYFELNQVYGGTKLAIILFSKELARRLVESNVKVCSVHPGIVRTDIIKDGIKNDFLMKFILVPIFFPLIMLMTKNLEQGSQTTLHCVLMPYEKFESGKYYADCMIKNPRKMTENTEISGKLWDISEKTVKL